MTSNILSDQIAKYLQNKRFRSDIRIPKDFQNLEHLMSFEIQKKQISHAHPFIFRFNVY